MIPRIVPPLALLALVAPAGCQAPESSQEGSAPGGDVALESEQDKTIYTLGYFVMRRASDFRLSEEERRLALAGADDALAGREPRVDPQQYQNRIGSLLQERQSEVAEAEKGESQAWLEEMAGETGAVQTPSGLVFIEREPGTGAQPEAGDTVRVHYHGTLRDGTVFDSSVERDTPATFPLDRVIPCWTEALQRMREGGKAHILCPAKIAYGDRGFPPHIKPGAALSFEVELIEVLGDAESGAAGESPPSS